jgi:hypothetical protein
MSLNFVSAGSSRLFISSYLSQIPNRELVIAMAKHPKNLTLLKSFCEEIQESSNAIITPKTKSKPIDNLNMISSLEKKMTEHRTDDVVIRIIEELTEKKPRIKRTKVGKTIILLRLI